MDDWRDDFDVPMLLRPIALKSFLELLLQILEALCHRQVILHLFHVLFNLEVLRSILPYLSRIHLCHMRLVSITESADVHGFVLERDAEDDAAVALARLDLLESKLRLLHLEARAEKLETVVDCRDWEVVVPCGH